MTPITAPTTTNYILEYVEKRNGMNRREFLVTGGLVTGLSGCLDQLPSTSEPGMSSTFPSVTARPDEVQPSRDARIDVEVIRQFSTTSPAWLRVAYTNEASVEREVVYATTVPFPPHPGQKVDGDGKLSLVPDVRENVQPHPRPPSPAPDPFVPTGPTDGCWRATASVSGNDIGLIKTLAPDETITGRYIVLAHRESDTCLAPGTYRFEDANYFGRSHPWGFDLELEK